MARHGDRESSMSVLERLLANAALRDEAGRLRSPEPRAPPPTGVSQGVWGGVHGALAGSFPCAGGGCAFCLLGRPRQEGAFLGRKGLGTHPGPEGLGVGVEFCLGKK